MSFILPGTSRQAQLDEHNVGFMWRLCHEYMLEALQKECEDFINTAKPSAKLVLQAQSVGMERRVDACISQLLAQKTRDWTPCFEDKAVMRRIIKRSMDHMDGLETHVHKWGRLDFGSLQCGVCSKTSFFTQFGQWQCGDCAYKKVPAVPPLFPPPLFAGPPPSYSPSRV